MMSLRMSLTVPLRFLIFISGVGAQNGWSVTYYNKSICALKGSTVIMGCTYSYPWDHTVQTAFWTKSWPSAAVEPPDLLVYPWYRDRVQYLGDKHNDCRLRLRDVRESDQSKYYFRFITNKEGGKYQGKDGVSLSVAGLQVEGPERVMEGDEVTLTCKTTCRLTDRTSFTWYRNGAALSSSTEQLYLQSVSREDAGRYSCAVLDQNLHSPEITLSVRYPPKSVSVSISPSGKIVEGSSVTLTCSSDGNPPVEYTWYKGSSSVATGKTFTLNKISSVNSGEYKCRSSNKHGEKYSDTVTLNVLYPSKNISVSISPSGEIVEGSSVTLTCSSDGNSPVQKYTWFKDGGSSPVGSGHNYSFTLDSESSGQYYCEVQDEHGSKISEAVLLSFKANQSFTLYVIVGVVIGCVGLVLALINLIIWRKRRGPAAEQSKPKWENIYSSVAVDDTTNDPPPDAAHPVDVFYARVQLPRPKKPTTKERSAVSHEEVQYSTIQPHGQEVRKTGEDDVQYASVSFPRTVPSHRSAEPNDPSVIYSRVK